MNKSKLIIRKIGFEDLDSLFSVGRQEFGGEYWFTKKYLENTIAMPCFAYGAFLDQRLVGGILAKELDRPKLWIFFFVVGHDFRRQGIGTKLLEKIKLKCTKNYPFLFVDVGVNDIIANNFYKKSKFRKLAKLDNWFGVHQDAYIYSRKIK